LSFSSPYAFIEMGSDGAPVLDGIQFNEIMATYGFNVRRRRVSQTKDCPCYDPVGLQANPTCSFCEGTGSVSGYLDEIIRGFLLFNVPNGMWAIGDINTKAGQLERTDCIGFFPPESDVRISDLIILVTSAPNAATETWHEMRVYTNVPRIVGDGSGNYLHIFSRCDMRHVDYPTSEVFVP